MGKFFRRNVESVIVPNFKTISMDKVKIFTFASIPENNEIPL